jgi:hypothetical protein
MAPFSLDNIEENGKGDELQWGGADETRRNRRKKKKRKTELFVHRLLRGSAHRPFSLSVGSFYKYNSGVVTVVFFLVVDVAVETIRSRGSKKYWEEAKRAAEVDRLNRARRKLAQK